MNALERAEQAVRAWSKVPAGASLSVTGASALVVELDRLREVEAAAQAVVDDGYVLCNVVHVDRETFEHLDAALDAAPDVAL